MDVGELDALAFGEDCRGGDFGGMVPGDLIPSFVCKVEPNL
jgi:hypothetical protein